MFDKKELESLVSFSDRVIYLYDRKWCGSKRSFCRRFNISKTTFYEVYNGKLRSFSDYVIEKFARAFGVSFEFMKMGGGFPGYYKPILLSRVWLEEDRAVYGSVPGRKPRTSLMGASAFAEIRLNDAEQVMEIILKIDYKDISF